MASRNPKKREELASLLDGLGVTLLGPDDVPGAPEVVEDADTFLGNAHKKARAFADASGKPALADDSGLEVDALYGAPGVRSHRFAGPDASDADNNRKLLDLLAGVPRESRRGRFRCAVVVVWPDGSSIESEGTCDGEILEEPRGGGGFGYDPLFLVPEHGKTFAELPSAVKNRASHRAKALAGIRSALVDRVNRER